MAEKGRPSRGGSPSRPHSPTKAEGEASRRDRSRCSQLGCTPAAHHGCTPYATRQSTRRLRRAVPEASVASQSSSLVLTTQRLRIVEASSGARQWQCVSKRSGSAAAAAAGLSGATDAVDAGAVGVVSGLRGGFMCGSRWARARRAEGKKERALNARKTADRLATRRKTCRRERVDREYTNNDAERPADIWIASQRLRDIARPGKNQRKGLIQRACG